MLYYRFNNDINIIICICILLYQIDNIHRSGCTTLDVSGDGRHLATAGDKVIKIWDYNMRLDLNFQVNNVMLWGSSLNIVCVCVCINNYF